MMQGFGYELAAVMPMAIETGLFVSSASFSAPDTAQGPTGNRVGTFFAVNGLQDIPCQKVPFSRRNVAADTKRTVPDIETDQMFHVLLNGFYSLVPSGPESGWIVNVDGIDYELKGSDSDSQSQMTRCKIRKVAI